MAGHRRARIIYNAIGACMAVLLLTGTVRAQPLFAQIDLSPEFISGLTALLGVGGAVLIISLFLFLRIMQTRTPATATDVQKGDIQLRQKEAENEADRLKLERDRFDEEVKDNERKAQQFDRMLGQLEKDHARMHDSESSHARLSMEQLKVEQGTEKALTNIGNQLDALRAWSDGINNRLNAIDKSVGVGTTLPLADLRREIESAASSLTAVVGDFKRIVESLRPQIPAQTSAPAVSIHTSSVTVNPAENSQITGSLVTPVELATAPLDTPKEPKE